MGTINLTSQEIEDNLTKALFNITLRSVAPGGAENTEQVDCTLADTWYYLVPTIANYEIITEKDEWFGYDSVTGIITWLGPTAVLEQNGNATVQHSDTQNRTVHIGFIPVGSTVAETMGAVDTRSDNKANIAVDTHINVETGDQFRFGAYTNNSGIITLSHVDAYLSLYKIVRD